MSFCTTWYTDSLSSEAPVLRVRFSAPFGTRTPCLGQLPTHIVDKDQNRVCGIPSMRLAKGISIHSMMKSPPSISLAKQQQWLILF